MKAVVRPKQSNHHVDEHGTWAISYGDMITLLLTFFILFFNSESSTNVLRRLKIDIATAAEKESGGADKNAGTGSGNSERTPAAENKNEGKDNKQSAENKPNVENLNIGKNQGKNIDKILQEELGAVISNNGNNLVVEFPGVSFFDFSREEVTNEGAKALDKFMETYRQFSGRYIIGIRAFTDHKKVRAGAHRYQDNLELSALRSIATMRVMYRLGLPLKNMRIAGYGEYKNTDKDTLTPEVMDFRAKDKGVPLARKVVLIIEPVNDGGKHE